MATASKRSKCSSDEGEAVSGHSTDIEQIATKRVFVNRSLNMAKIKYVGFDMDYTLAVYKSPVFEELVFELTKKRMVDIGYPAAILEFEYDAKFCVRGLWFDTKYGNLLKVDTFGNILVAIHGFHFLSTAEIKTLYPNSFVKNESDDRIFILNTLFGLPETYLLACLVQYFVDEEDYTILPEGAKKGDLYMPWSSIHSDVRSSVDYVHLQGPMKQETMANLEKYVERDPRLAHLLIRLQSSDIKTFLLTNSGFEYTNAVMTYLLEDSSQPGGRPWKSYFDYIMVDARKPHFFSSGTTLRQVDENSGSLCLGVHTGTMEKHAVYAGGSSDVFAKMVGSRGADVLYVGDHIFGDILKSKKQRGWRTFLVVPELCSELGVWMNKSNLFDKLQELDGLLSDVYKNMEGGCMSTPKVDQLKSAIRDTSMEMDQCYGKLGSLFRSGSRMTFFAGQVMRYADLYAGTFLNLLHYPLCYMFRAPPMLMPHESTVAHSEYSLKVPGSPSHSANRHYLLPGRQEHHARPNETSSLHHTRPNSPDEKAHFFDGDDDDGSESADEANGFKEEN